MISLEERISIISKHDAKKTVPFTEDVTQEDVKTLKQLKDLGLDNTPQAQRLLTKIKLKDKTRGIEKLNEEIIEFEKMGLKILDRDFVESFAEKLGLVTGSPEQYIKDIPSANLNTIHNKIRKFKTELRFNTVLTDNVNFYRNNALGFISMKSLKIIAPKEHFDSSLATTNPDPIAVLELKDHYLYLDAWDLDGGIFKLGLNLPEVLN